MPVHVISRITEDKSVSTRMSYNAYGREEYCYLYWIMIK